MIALCFFGVAAATMADFDLAALPSAGDFARVQRPGILTDRSLRHDLSPKIQAPEAASDDEGIRLKLRWRKVRLVIPFGPN